MKRYTVIMLLIAAAATLATTVMAQFPQMPMYPKVVWKAVGTSTIRTTAPVGDSSQLDPAISVNGLTILPMFVELGQAAASNPALQAIMVKYVKSVEAVDATGKVVVVWVAP